MKPTHKTQSEKAKQVIGIHPLQAASSVDFLLVQERLRNVLYELV